MMVFFTTTPSYGHLSSPEEGTTLGVDHCVQRKTVKPSNINNRGYEHASTLGLLWLSNIDPDGVAHRLGHSVRVHQPQPIYP